MSCTGHSQQNTLPTPPGFLDSRPPLKPSPWGTHTKCRLCAAEGVGTPPKALDVQHPALRTQ